MKTMIPDDENNRLKQENEEKKKQLQEEFGAKYWSSPNASALPPEIENEFLNQIMAYENSYKETKQVSVYEFIEKPPYRKLYEISDEELSEELENLLTYMNEHQVNLDTLCEVDDRELYRFITEELFLQEMDDMHIPGMMSCFIYEELHPNHGYDIDRYANEFFRSYLDKSTEFSTHELSTNASTQEWHKHFRDAFSRFDIQYFNILTLNFDIEKEIAEVEFDCEFTGQVDGSKEVLLFKGKGVMGFVYQWDFWYVDSIKMPESKVN